MKNTFYSQGNPYNIVRTASATYTASVGELIIADETEITLPSGVPAGSVIAVRSSNDTVTTDVVGASGSIDGFSAGATHQEAKTGEYVYDGSDWYLRNNVDVRDGAIPDSAIHQFPIDEGSGTSFNSDNGVTASFNGDPIWESDANVAGGNWLFFDGVEDEAIVPTSDNNRINPGSVGTVALTIQIPSGNTPDNKIMWNGSNGTERCYCRLDNGDGTVTLGLGDGSTNTGTSISFGSRVRIAWGWDTGDYNIAINGSIQDSGTYTGSVDLGGEWSWGSAGGSNYTEMYHDNTIIYGSKLTESEYAEDFNSQRWS